MDRLGERIRASFSPGKQRATQTQKFDQLVKILSSETFGPLNALTAAQVFRVLLQEGEGEAHGGLGFLGFFTMIWSLERRYPDPLARGASLGPWGPTAYVSAKCLLPIARTSRICQVRAKYLQQAAVILDELSVAAVGAGEYDHWRFACSCEQLSKTLFDLVEIALQPEKVRASAERLADIADSLAAVDQWGSESEARWREVLDGVDTALRAIGAASREMTREVAATLNQVDRRSWRSCGRSRQSGGRRARTRSGRRCRSTSSRNGANGART